MAFPDDFPPAPVDGETFTDPDSGITWAWEDATGRWKKQVVDTATQADLDAEIAARVAADEAAANALGSEASTRAAADSAETAARTAADTAEATARAAADTAESSARTTAIAAEAATRADADDAEATARADADVSLQGQIDFQANVRQDTDEALQAAIDDEVVARDAADDAETAARIAGDSALDVRVDAVEAILPLKADLVGGVVPTSQIPALAISDVFVVADQAAMLALTAQRGDVAVRTDNTHRYILASDSPTTLADWIDLGTPADLVLSINGQTGVVVLGPADVGADPAGAAAAVASALTAHIDDTVDAHDASAASLPDDLLGMLDADTAEAAFVAAMVFQSVTEVEAQAIWDSYVGPYYLALLAHADPTDVQKALENVAAMIASYGATISRHIVSPPDGVAHPATAITVDASGFDGNLTTDDDTVQKVAQKVDDLVASGGSPGFARMMLLGGM